MRRGEGERGRRSWKGGRFVLADADADEGEGRRWLVEGEGPVVHRQGCGEEQEEDEEEGNRHAEHASMLTKPASTWRKAA